MGMDDSGEIYSEVDLVGYKGELPYVGIQPTRQEIQS